MFGHNSSSAFSPLGLIRPAAIVAALALAPAAIAGPKGDVTYIGLDGATHKYRITDSDLIRNVRIRGGIDGGWKDEYKGAGEHDCPPTVDVFIPITEAGATHWITWNDCQADNGKKWDHWHLWELPKNQGKPKDQTPKQLEMIDVEQIGTSGALGLREVNGLPILGISARGLIPNFPYQVFVYMDPNAPCGTGPFLPVQPLISGPDGRAVFSVEVPLPIHDIYAVAIKTGGPNGQTILCGRDLDEDGDGVRDLLDNCAWMYNPTQLDSNGDGVGDNCDCNGNGTDDLTDVTNGAGLDLDGNGVVDTCQAPVCPADFNGDGVLDIDDFIAFQTGFGVGCR